MHAALLLTVLPLVCLAQSATPAFDVASIKPTPRESVQTGYGGEVITARPGSLIMRNVRVRACIKWAYDVKDYQISGPSLLGAPFWLGGDVARFEIQGKAPENTPVEQLKLMLQSLLAERFKLAFHRETKETSALALTSLKPTLKAAAESDAHSRAIAEPAGFTLVNMSMPEFAELMSGPLRIPVVDQTGISGRFDFTLKFDTSAMRDDPTYAFMSAIREQLGLKMERQKLPIEMLIVDSLEKTPTEN